MFARFLNYFRGGVLETASGEQLPYPTRTSVSNLKEVDSGVALQISAVWSCVDLISKTLASMPMQVFEQKGNRRIVARGSKLWMLLHDSPNGFMTPFEFWRAILLDVCLRGNGYAVIDRSSNGEAFALFPVSADQVRVFMQTKDDLISDVIYRVEVDGEWHYLPKDRIFHVKGMGKGLVGLANLNFMRPTLDESVKMQENASMLFGSGSAVKGVLTVDHNIDEKQKKALGRRYGDLQVSNENGLWILPADMKYQQVSLSPADTQLLESRKMSRQEICQWFGVPEILINGSSDKVEEAMDLFYKTTIRPLAVNVEQAIRKNVLTAEQRKTYVCEFNLDAMLRASLASRAEVYAKMVQNGLKTRNECRELENDEPIEGGDGLTVQNNLVPIDRLGETDPSQTSQKELPDEIRQ